MDCHTEWPRRLLSHNAVDQYRVHSWFAGALVELEVVVANESGVSEWTLYIRCRLVLHGVNLCFDIPFTVLVQGKYLSRIDHGISSVILRIE